jgi:hypothetical protein
MPKLENEKIIFVNEFFGLINFISYKILVLIIIKKFRFSW